ncbi:hypothetical protein HacjB3_18253 (plasmid) [Halalkalicoccus jeotgali B3]|uniref:Uncharacterized protein n=1 Tax=Halalkalicoccus jeotgali (strain DSM 18796 / CECT 7217 / JCM 14584 / KCTC 4019 / B3) TaxID=795797 RepID=D8JC55_HALJB|nr:hypothetical protein [Halalkalicoccus jeotgali]ADJ16962.1 hypothetical protein HacjB3_18098 [Halalkalicoccus jeotgali B3]ADJ16993.1 hypothetical protein HacjB3_18253 [Halalkalicoccus jeotgali B3]
MNSNRELDQEQVDLLYDHRRMKDRGEDPVLVSEQSVDAIREVLGTSLGQRGVADPDSLDLDALAGQFIAMDRDEANETVTALSQQPETGGASPELLEDNDEGSVEDLTAEERNTAREKLESAQRMETRAPQYAEAQRQEAADILNTSHEDIDLEAL